MEVTESCAYLPILHLLDYILENDLTKFSTSGSPKSHLIDGFRAMSSFQLHSSRLFKGNLHISSFLYYIFVYSASDEMNLSSLVEMEYKPAFNTFISSYRLNEFNYMLALVLTSAFLYLRFK